MSSYQSESARPETAVVQVVESCQNCATLQQQLDTLRLVHSEEQHEREKESQAMQEQYNLLKKDLDLAVEAKHEEIKKREEIQKQQLTQLKRGTNAKQGSTVSARHCRDRSSEEDQR
nr:uncharacterized protein LOC115264178 [Aedes albopictus]